MHFTTKMRKRYTITSALIYANGPIHIGHLAGAYLPADIYSRYLKLKGHDVAFISGSDEHGAAITIQSKKEDITPKEIVEKYHLLNKESFKEFGINFDIFHRTSSKIHHETSQEFFKDLYNNQHLSKKTTEEFFDNKNEQFLADRYIRGTCPKCGFTDAFGDQCESCGCTLSPNELINPKSTISGESPIKKETTHWYLPMNKHEKWLNEWINNGKFENKQTHNPNNWKSQVIGQCRSWIEGGLKPRAMTRDLDWGVKVPIKNLKNKVLYVWMDAPIGYISATKQWAINSNKNWEDYWTENNSELIHFIGKDNIVFHCIIFPILLKSSKTQYILPKNVPANEFLNLEGKKLSTSRNWAIWLHEYLNDFKNQQDSLRYSLCATAPETKDTDFTWKEFQANNNNELVSIFGNFINRVLVLTNKYYNGIVPEITYTDDVIDSCISKLSLYPEKIGNQIEKYKFRSALSEFMNLCRLGNKFLADNEPWKIHRENPEKTASIMNIALQIAGSITILCEPFMPFTSKKLYTMIGIQPKKWDDAGKSNLLIPGHKIKTADHLFKKIEDDLIEKQINKLHQTN